MSMHVYHSGEHVRVIDTSLSGPTTTEEFEIMRRYLVEGGEDMYMLRSIRDHRHRVVPGRELTQSSRTEAIVNRP